MIVVLAEGSRVQLTGPSANGWQPVVCGGKQGYVSAQYLNSVPFTPTPGATGTPTPATAASPTIAVNPTIKSTATGTATAGVTATTSPTRTATARRRFRTGAGAPYAPPVAPV
ncbi:MAG: hypothetical protein QM589_02355 [Thermomicrobiales bacterium]